MIDSIDNTVTVCMDYIKSRCTREKCKYFHPPAHLQAKIKSSQQVNQTAVAAQAAAAAVVRQSLIPLTIDLSDYWWIVVVFDYMVFAMAS